ncbi:MAG: ABC transporter ATP-binding protein [Candidatus Enterosoma sp.]|nr:ABC transporter ATP-binding protein [bacterium]MDY5865627.1 ABC transporter ATP-binding protein [Candidatus Enterosoma sp.]
MIEIKNVSKKYSNHLAVDDLTLTIPNGKVVGLLGPNGAGKSTTLKMIAGILSIDKGNISIDGKDIFLQPDEAKDNFGYVFDTPDMFLTMKGVDFLNFISSIYSIDRKEAMDYALNLAEKLDMKTDLNKYIADLSHGMRQKIFIISSLMHKPNNWILDEPLVGLDPKSAFQVKEIMRDIAKDNRTVLYSTHVLETAEKICDEVAIIDKGKLVFYGTVEDLKILENEDASLESLFLDLTK